MPHRHERQSEDQDRSSGTPQRSAGEQEAPRIDRLSAADLTNLQQSAGNLAVSRLVAQRRMAPTSSVEEVTPGDLDRVTSKRGSRLDEPIMRRAENATGMRMDHVEMHTGPDAERVTAALQARALTVGSHIVVGKSGNDPETIIHETEHVRQQAAGKVPGRTTAGGVQVSHPNDPAERAATAVASAEMRNPAPEPAALHHPGDGHDHGPVQRVTTDDAVAESSATAAARGRTEGRADDTGEQAREISPEGREDIKYKLSLSISRNALEEKVKVGFWDYFSRPWISFPDQFLPEKQRMLKALERRAVRGMPFTPWERDQIDTLSRKPEDQQWLQEIGIGTTAEARNLVDSNADNRFKNWVQLPHGRRILAATLAFRRHRPGDPQPTDPAYTLGRFMHTQQLDEDSDERKRLERDRDEQIRKTAVDSLHPESMDPGERHPNADQVSNQDRNQAAAANEIITNILHVLQAGLKVRDAEGNYTAYEGDVIRALAHGGRVTIRVPALTAGQNANDLLNTLGVLQDESRNPAVKRRGFATHDIDIDKNSGAGDSATRGGMIEHGGLRAGIPNALTEGTLKSLEDLAALLHLSPDQLDAVKLMSADPAITGLGAKDFNGDMVLPNGSYGHLLLVWLPPTQKKDGALLVGLETTAADAKSPVGYKHSITSTEATANPESMLHGHKPDKIGAGGTKEIPRMVDLNDLGTGWRDVLEGMKATFGTSKRAAVSPAIVRRLYERLVGPRQNL